MYSSSSGTRGRVNADGSRDCFCYQCGEFIARTYFSMSRALCAMCQAVADGKVLTEDAIRQYKLSKADKTDVSMLLVEDELPKEASKRFSLFRSLGGAVAAAIGIVKPKTETPKSVKIAREKKRPRLFENIEIGSMVEVDQELKKKR